MSDLKQSSTFDYIVSDKIEAVTEVTTISSDSEGLEETDKDDATLIREAEDQVLAEPRYFVAASLLKQVRDVSLLRPEHLNILKWAHVAEAGMRDLLESPETEGRCWKKQTESHGERDFTVYYRVGDNNRLECRIDTVFESSLLIPILSVFNESDLYATWMPSWKKPFKLGIEQTKMLKESGRGNQIIQSTMNMAWPFSKREVIMHAVAIDVIDDEGAIVIQVLTESPEDDPVIPEPLPGVVRMDMSMSIVIRGCPSDHPCLEKSKGNYPEDEELILFCLKSCVDANLAAVPMSLVNFVTRTALGRVWASLLHVAEGVRDGERPLHKEAIASKRDLYDFVENRIDVMIQKVKGNSRRGKAPKEMLPRE